MICAHSAASATHARTARPKSELPWRERPFITLQTAEQLASLSRASLYKLAEAGRLKLKRLGGRVLVETASLVKLLDEAEDWTPSPAREKI